MWPRFTRARKIDKNSQKFTKIDKNSQKLTKIPKNSQAIGPAFRRFGHRNPQFGPLRSQNGTKIAMGIDFESFWAWFTLFTPFENRNGHFGRPAERLAEMGISEMRPSSEQRDELAPLAERASRARG